MKRGHAATPPAHRSSRWRFRVASFLAILATLLLALAGTARADEFAYRLPDGFLNLSAGAPAGNFAQVPPDIARRARGFKAYAVALEEGQPKAEFSVSVGEGTGSISDSVDTILSIASKHPEHTGFEILDKTLVTIGGVECARGEFSVRVDDVEVRKLFYVLPLGSQRAWFGLEGTPDDLSAVRAAFEVSVRSARGLKPASDARAEMGRIGAIIGIAALIGVLLHQLFVRRKRPRRKARPQGHDRNAASST